MSCCGGRRTRGPRAAAFTMPAMPAIGQKGFTKLKNLTDKTITRWTARGTRYVFRPGALAFVANEDMHDEIVQQLIESEVLGAGDQGYDDHTQTAERSAGA